jgi:hypothetical protein
LNRGAASAIILCRVSSPLLICLISVSETVRSPNITPGLTEIGRTVLQSRMAGNFSFPAIMEIEARGPVPCCCDEEFQV